jgi:hypothetical protein
LKSRTILTLAAVPVLALATIPALALSVPGLCGSPFVRHRHEGALDPYWPCPPRTVYETSFCGFSGPECPETDALSAVNRAITRGDPLPPGFVLTRARQSETARTTGAVDWFGRHELALSVRTGMAELRAARLYLDDELVDEATWENGKLADLGDEAEASLRFFLPWIPCFRVKLVTENWDGRTEESSFSVGRSSAK